MRIVVLADYDDRRWRHSGASADLLLACGDLEMSMVEEAAAYFGCRRAFAVKGNNDGGDVFPASVTDLHLRVETFEGVRIGGFQGALSPIPRWRSEVLFSEEEAAQALAGFPAVDIFIAHNSPAGVHEVRHRGFQALHRYVLETSPRLFLHGHQHASLESSLGATEVIGVYGWRLIDWPRQKIEG